MNKKDTLETGSFQMVKTGTQWRIKPEPGFNLLIGGNYRMLEMLATIVGNPDNVEFYRSKAQRGAAVAKVKQISTAVRAYLADNRHVYPSNAAQLPQLLGRYLRDNTAFTSPLDAPGTVSFQMNQNLESVPSNALTSPAKTVLIYERGELLNLPEPRYGGQAVVGFADGSVRLVSRKELRRLRLNF